ncbi:MAG: Omp28-related outer membrane protein [Bacteroidota bacterium]|nr:Omp28-related outer membrane protein [Bacteroidota bacterium]
MIRMRWPLALVACVLLTASVFAQSPRFVLFEEATNASCPPCARENPTFQKYIERPHIASRAVTVIYHASWPGRDVMYSANPAMHTARIVDYYGINGVPTVVVNGRPPARVTGGWDGAPSDTIALNNALARYPETSPLAITVSEQASGSQVDVEVAVTSSEAVSGKKLRIVVVEGYHFYASAGTNGEKDFPYIARAMLPSPAGIDFAIAANETKRFDQSFTLDAEWNAEALFVVAFIQDDATREVLQVGTDRIRLECLVPAVAKVGSGANDPVTFDAVLRSPVAGEFTVTTTLNAPAGWTHALSVNGVPATSPATVTLERDVPLTVSVEIVPAATKNRGGSVDVVVRGTLGGMARASFRMYAGGITVPVLVMDEGNAAIGQSYSQALERGPYPYALIVPDDIPLFDVARSPVLVCEVGKNVLGESDVDLLKSYLDGGGRLFITGAEIAWGLADPDAQNYGFYRDPDFVTRYLHADYVRDDNPATTIRGVPGDPIGDGFNISFTGGVQNQDTPDEIAPRDGAIPVFYYGTGNEVAGLRYADAKNRLVYFGFGLEGIGIAVSRGEILTRVIGWLMGQTGVELSGASVSPAVHVFPNPASEHVTAAISVEAGACIRAVIYDMAGRLVAVSPLVESAESDARVVFDCRLLPQGEYLLHIDAGHAKAARLFRVVH